MSTLSVEQWQQLRKDAQEAARRAYAPYSHLGVGAAAVTSTGGIVVGSNVENASFGLTLCAECSLVSDLVRTNAGRLVAVMVVAHDGQTLTPCGRCRQLLFEHGGASLEVCGDEPGNATTLGSLLPGAFGPDDLAERSGQ
jgi:cytidine deaminase